MSFRAFRPSILCLTIVGLVLLSASAPRAFEATALSPTSFTVAPGELFTIELAFDNASRDTIQGCEVDLTGLSGVASVVSGEAAKHFFVQICVSGSCFAGVDSVANAFYDYRDLTAGGYAPGDDSVELIRALTLNPTNQDGSLDPGLDGALDEPSARDVTITLQAIASGTLAVRGSFSTGTDVLELVLPEIQVSVIPEPGTALLVGLGLGMLGSTRRSRSEATVTRRVRGGSAVQTPCAPRRQARAAANEGRRRIASA